MGVIKNEVGRPSNKSIMIRRILKLILLLVIVAGVFCAGYYIKDKEDANKKEDNKVKEEESKQEFDKSEAEKILENVFDKNYKLDMQFLGYYNDDVNIFNKDFYKTLVSIRNTEKTKKYNCGDIYADAKKVEDNKFVVNLNYYCENVYEYADVSKTFNSKFKQGKLLKENMDEKLDWFSDEFSYSDSKNVYTIMTQDNGDLNDFIAGIYNAYKIDNRLYVKLVFNHFEYSESNDNGTNIVTLKLHDGTLVENYNLNFGENSLYGIEDEELIHNYGDHMQMYELEFEETKTGYKFVNSSKIK